MALRQRRLVILDEPQAMAKIAIGHEDTFRTDVVRRRIQRHYEMTGEQVFPFHRINRLRIDEYVRERCRSVANVRVSVEKRKQIPDLFRWACHPVCITVRKRNLPRK